jgi:ribosomal protein S18 acetylase RimI-like enzyme
MPRSRAAQGLWDPLVDVGSKPVYAMGVKAAVGMARELPAGLVITTAPDRADVVAAYGGWMDDLPLAELLVSDDDLVHQRRRFVCGLVDGRAVGCALVRWSERTAHLSGIGVLAAERGRGYGWALTAEAARVAVEDAPYDRPAVVWMYATDEGAALYSRMGFERIDDHVSLSDP